MSTGQCLLIFQTIVLHLQGEVVLDYVPEDLSLNLSGG